MDSQPQTLGLPLESKRVYIAGPLSSVTRVRAVELIRAYGGADAKNLDDSVSIVLVADDAGDWQSRLPEPVGGVPWFEVLSESEMWRRLGMLEEPEEQARLYTPTMLGELVGVAPEAISRWRRRGYLRATRELGRMPLFAIGEVHVARNLAALLQEGCSQSRVDKLVAQLIANEPDIERPLAELAVVVQEGKICLRRGDGLVEPGGQLLFDFNQTEAEDDDRPASIAFGPRLAQVDPTAGEATNAAPTAEDARLLALDLQAEGDLPGAIEACRAALLFGGGPEDHVLLAQLLYQSGDSAGARERYFTALEADPSDLEARTSLGCLLAESGDAALAEAAFRGALEQTADFADAHYHLARLLDESNRDDEAIDHWRRFLEVAPASPWAEEATERLSESEDKDPAD